MDLIKITEKDGQQLVSARELYEGLELNKSNWVRWIDTNIIHNEFFLENIDWVGFVTVTKGNETKDFAISLEFAKHIAMMAKTKKSHEYRNYFIQCEKKVKELKRITPQNYIEALKALVVAEEERLLLEQRVAEYEPKITYLDTILECQEAITVTQIAADYGMSASKLNKTLAEEGIQWKVGGQWILKGVYKEQGYTKSHTQLDGQGKPRLNTKWTQKGRVFIHNLLEDKGIKATMDKEERYEKSKEVN